MFRKQQNNVVVLSLRKKNLPYLFIWIFYYAWVVTFTTWWTASPVTEKVFDSGLRSLIHSINLLSSAAFVFIIRKEWFVKASRIGAVLIIAGMSLFLIIPQEGIQLVTVIFIGITLGIVNISILIPYVFVLNNTEKFYSVVGSHVLINLILLLQFGLLRNQTLGQKEHLITFLLLIIPLSATIFFKNSSLDTKKQEAESPPFKSRIYLSLAYNCTVAILCKGVGKGILDITAEKSGNFLYQTYYIGGLAGCLIYVLVYAFAKKGTMLLNNIIFSSIAMGLLCNAFASETPVLAYIFAVLLGIGSSIGMIHMYYILGVVGKKYNSLRYVRLSILWIGICGGVAGVMVGNLIASINTRQISILASIGVAVFLILFLMLSPYLSQIQQFDDWAKDSVRVEINNEIDDPFKQYKLSKRETEVCNLLLEGYTLRQISVLLSIAYSTVNTYCTSSYRKLNINSRTELLLLFMKDQKES